MYFTHILYVGKPQIKIFVLGTAFVLAFIIFTIYFCAGKLNRAPVQNDTLYVSPGDSITCFTVGTPLPTVTWKRHNNKQVTSGLGSATLRVSGASDVGPYSCYAENQFGTDEEQFVVLLDTFSFIDYPPETLHLKVGEKARVHCSAALRGRSVNVSWSLPDCLGCNSNYKSSARDLGNGTLRLVSAKIWDSGVYHCTAKANGVTQTAAVTINVGNQPTGKIVLIAQTFFILLGKI